MAPEDVETKPAASFRVYQDNAETFQHNKRLTKGRQRRLEEAHTHQRGAELPAPVRARQGRCFLRQHGGSCGTSTQEQWPPRDNKMQAACRTVMESPSEENVVALLDLWSPEWKHPGRQRAIGSGSYEQYCTLGLFAYGGNDPRLSKASVNEEACVALNHFLRSRFPAATWPSIAVVLNPRIGLHRDTLNMIGKPNHAIALGSFTGGRIWVEDDHGSSPERRVMKHKTQELWGSWIDMHDKPVSFDARRFHRVEPHEGRMWAIAVYTPQAFKRCSPKNREAAAALGFPVR